MGTLAPVRIASDPGEAARIALSRGIQRFNAERVPELEPVESERVFYVVSNHGDVVQGGLRGRCYWNTLHIELLWLAPTARGAGLGTRIMAAAEAEAFRIGCAHAHVETTDWQAAPFYKRLGYTELGRLAGRPAGRTTIWLTKTLSR